MRTAGDVTLPLVVDRDDPRPLPRQLADEVRRVIGEGLVSPGELVPATRTVAHRLGVSRGTVVAAYDQLLAEGYLVGRVGHGTVVNPDLRDVHPPALRPGGPRRTTPTTAPALVDLRPGQPWTSDVVNAAWRTAWRGAATHPLTSLPTAGLPELRTEIADHLRRMRGVRRAAEHVIVTAGARDGLALLLAALGPGRVVGVEDPGYPSLRRVPPRLGSSVTPLPTDESGLVCDDLPTGTAAPHVVVVTPSHQYPLGGSLPVARRQALLDWARREHVVVVEDDYDSELRYTSAPLPALASLDDPQDGCVVTLGTFAKTLGPGLGVGFLVAPERLVEELRRARADLGQPVSQVTQWALASYLASGELRRHTQRMRREYRRRRALVLEVLGDLPDARVKAMDGGLHAVLESEVPEPDLIERIRARGVVVAGLADYWSRPAAGAGGIVLGYGGVPVDQLRRALVAIAEATVTA
ncbi:MAG TPA: PLP-dependent aminotransferase family protein [Propionibacteriaceae bacterium]|nr:PLP-dependent aminotransferase family protein [Propionibacteriaceae bacterium]